MEIPVYLRGLEHRNLSICITGAFSKPKLMLDGEPLKKHQGCFWLPSSSGEQFSVKFRKRFLDAVPDLEVRGEIISVLTPLQWYQYAWMTLPLLLLVLGGAVGGLCGVVAAALSSRVFRSELSENLQYAASAFISSGACVAYLLLATMILGTPK
jgi:hypothetical protein